MPNEVLKKFSEELKTVRENKNITLQQIANKTKIDIKFLRAIEEAKFDILPDIYIRAFIKEYCLSLDLDPVETIKKYEIALKGKPEEKNNTEETPAKEETKVEPQNVLADAKNSSEKIKNLFLANYKTGAAVLVFVIIALFLIIRESSPDFIPENNLENLIESDIPAYEIDSSKIVNIISDESKKDSLNLNVNVLKRVWVKVISDSTLKYEGMLKANSKINYYAARNFRIVLGNAGSVELYLGGKPIVDFGKEGEIRNLIINADTVRGYTIIPSVKNENKSPEKN